MGANTYRIEDEPTPGSLARLAVQPLWPLLGMMLGGFAFGMAWFVFNGFAVGSPTRWKECLLAVVGLAGTVLITGTWVVAMDMGYLPDDALAKYAVLPMLIWRLAIGYSIYMMQARSIELYEYFGGELRNGLPLVVIFALLRAKIMVLVPNTLWTALTG